MIYPPILLPVQVMKVDTLTGDVTTWKEPGHFVSEPVFIPRPGKNMEHVLPRLKSGILSATYYARISGFNPVGNMTYGI